MITLYANGERFGHLRPDQVERVLGSLTSDELTELGNGRPVVLSKRWTIRNESAFDFSKIGR